MIDIDELKRRSIEDLALTMGYKRDEARSNGGSVAMRSDHDHIVIKRSDAGHSVYFSVGNHDDHGSIVDFVQHRHGCGYVEAVNIIQGKGFSLPIGRSSIAPAASIPATDYRKKALATWSSARWVPQHPYLLSRGLSPAVLAEPRFADTFRLGTKGAVLFPHFDRGGLCGYEIRSESFKGFGSGCRKGLWVTPNWRSAPSLIVCEGSIDCLSHAALYGGDAAYCSFGGGLGRTQLDLLSGLFKKAHARGCEVVLGVDNDSGGVKYATDLIASHNYLSQLIPVGKDFNEDLLAVAREVS